jgi:hypothetical protein
MKAMTLQSVQSVALERGLYKYDCDKKLPYSGENFSFGAYLNDRYSIALSTVCGKIPVANIDPYNSSNMMLRPCSQWLWKKEYLKIM